MANAEDDRRGNGDSFLRVSERGRDEVPAAVLAVVLLVYQVADGQLQPWYIDRGALVAAGASGDVDAAIYFAEVSGWLVGSREPPLGVAITAEGVRLLEDCALI